MSRNVPQCPVSQNSRDTPIPSPSDRFPKLPHDSPFQKKNARTPPSFTPIAQCSPDTVLQKVSICYNFTARAHPATPDSPDSI
jgi:hypothetical protein